MQVTKHGYNIEKIREEDKVEVERRRGEERKMLN